MDEMLLIDKPAGMTSFGVVARIRRVLSRQAGKKVKVGHTGTLDPFATGLMIILTGKRCREAGDFSKLDKVYESVIRFGETSSTGDPEGEISRASDREPSLDEVQQTLKSLTGTIIQKPPIYSAIKINGQRAYDLARQGKEVDMPTRSVEVYSLELLSYDYPHLAIRAHVSSGTYIRTLASDIGEALSVGAYCQSLRRTKVADYSVESAKTLLDFGVDN